MASRYFGTKGNEDVDRSFDGGDFDDLLFSGRGTLSSHGRLSLNSNGHLQYTLDYLMYPWLIHVYSYEAAEACR